MRVIALSARPFVTKWKELDKGQTVRAAGPPSVA